jgi:aryl-alcohol dehydrogenase-like predicted oxidoreductase
METRLLGPSSLRVSLVGLGCNNFGGRIEFEATRSVIFKALDLGITHFDTADVYGGGGKSEEFIGALLGSRRKEVILATKFGKMSDATPGTRGTRAYIANALEASLQRLQTDWIDLYYMHEPDPETPIEETLAALDDLTRSGKVRHVAASNFSPAGLDAAVTAAKTLKVAGFVASQDEYSLLDRRIEGGMADAIARHGLGLVPYFPLGGGALTGKYRKGREMPVGARHTRAKGGAERFLEPNWDLIEKLNAFAESRGRTLLELAMSWLARKPNVCSIIAGATKPEQLEANARSVEGQLSATEMAEVDRMTGPV